MQMFFKGSTLISRETSGSGMFFVQSVTMLSALFVLRRAILGLENEDECVYGDIMHHWLKVSLGFAMVAILCQFSVAIRYGNNLEYQYYVFCTQKSLNLYVHHGKSDGPTYRFGKRSSKGRYELDPKIDAKAPGAEAKDVNELEPCQRNLCNPALFGLLAFFVYLDLLWSAFGAWTIVDATDENCQDSETKTYWMLVAMCSASALFLTIAAAMVFVLGFRKDMCAANDTSKSK
jgi:hypothetical protein